MAKTIGLYSLAALASGATNTDQEIASFVAPHGRPQVDRVVLGSYFTEIHCELIKMAV